MKGHVLSSDEKYIYIQNKDLIYQYGEKGRRRFSRIEANLIKRILIKFRLCQRAMRTDIRASVTWRNDFYFAQGGALYKCNYNTTKRIINFRKGMNSPLSLVKIENLSGFDDQICFGEYFSNPNRDKVHIWSYDGNKCRVVYTFADKTVRHIHGIVPDKYRSVVYILTGDGDEESAVWIARNNFETIEKYIYGNQQARCCVLQPRKDCLVYATDSEYERNKLYKVNIDAYGRAEDRIVISELESSVIHGCIAAEEELYFSTTVEPNKGGVFTNKTMVYKLDAQCELTKLIEDEKDCFHPKYFQYGFANIVVFKDRPWIGFTGTKKYDGRVIELE